MARQAPAPGKEPPSAPSEAPPSTILFTAGARRRRWWRIWRLAVAGTLVLLVVGVLVWTSGREVHDETAPSESAPQPEEPASEPPTEDPEVGTEPPEGQPVRVADGLVSFFDFSSGDGDTVTDPVGGNDLTVAEPSAVSWTDEGLRFDEPTLARTGAEPTTFYEAVEASGAFTVEAWVTPANTDQNGPARIISLGRDVSTHNLIVGQGEHEGPSTLIEARLGRNEDDRVSSQEGSLDTESTHVAVTYEETGLLRLFLDGEVASERETGSGLEEWDTSHLLGLGAELDGKRPWLGTYHLVALYETALDEDEVAANHAAGPAADTDLPEPLPEPETPPDEPREARPEPPSDWQAAFESGDIELLRAWYAENTGHEANGYDTTDLTPVGSITTEADGQVIEAVEATSIRIAHDDVTIRNSRVTGAENYGIQYDDTWGQQVGGTLIEYVTFDGWNGAEGTAHHAAYLAANSSGATVRRVNISGYSSGVSMRANTSFEESWVHDLWRAPGKHGTSSTIRGENNASTRNLLEGPGYSSAQSLYADHGGPLDDALVEYNVMNDGTPHYQINVPDREHAAASENVRIRNNRFGPAASSPPTSGLSNLSHPSNDIRENGDF